MSQKRTLSYEEFMGQMVERAASGLMRGCSRENDNKESDLRYENRSKQPSSDFSKVEKTRPKNDRRNPSLLNASSSSDSSSSDDSNNTDVPESESIPREPDLENNVHGQLEPDLESSVSGQSEPDLENNVYGQSEPYLDNEAVQEEEAESEIPTKEEEERRKEEGAVPERNDLDDEIEAVKNGQNFLIRMDEAWRKFPIVTDSGGRRRFGGKYTQFFKVYLEKIQKNCDFKSSSNRVRKLGSRKTNAPFWSGAFSCRSKTCPCIAKLTIPSDAKGELQITFNGQSSHPLLRENLTKPTQMFTRAENEHKLPLFEEIGLDKESIDQLAGCDIPADGIFNAELSNRDEINHKLEDGWKLKLVSGTIEIGAYFRDIVKQYNKYCNFIVIYNHFRKQGSGRPGSCFWKGKMRCKHALCSCKVDLAIISETDGILKINFTGSISHDLCKRKSDHLKGVDRQSLQRRLFDSPSTPTSNVYREHLEGLDGDVFASGNRGNLGTSPAVVQQARNETKSKRTETLSNDIKSVGKSLEVEDQKKASVNQKSKRYCFGFVHDVSTFPNLRIVLTHESLVRLYHSLVTRDILYIDATGNVVEKIPGFKRILLYTLALRHPYSNLVALPVAQYVTSSHTVTSIASFLMKFREVEKVVKNGVNVTPKLIMTDQSLAIIKACLKEFTGESMNDFMNRGFRVVQGKANHEDLSKTIIHVCFSHIMNNTKKDLRKNPLGKRKKGEKKKIKDFVMTLFARLVECQTLHEMDELVRHAYLIMNSKNLTAKVQKSLEVIEHSIKEFPDVEAISKQQILENVSKEESEHSEEETSIHEKEEDVSDEEEKLEDGDVEAAEVGPLDEISSFWNERVHFYAEELKNNENDVVLKDNNSDSDGVEGDGEDLGSNMYFLPKYFEEFAKLRLPFCLLWSNMLLGDLNRFSTEYAYDASHNAKAKSIFIQNSTNAYSENLYTALKRDPNQLKVPVVAFISQMWNFLSGLRRQWVDGLMDGKVEVDKIEDKFAGKLVEELEGKGSKARKPFVEDTEAWSKKEKKSAIHNIPVPNQGIYRPLNNPDVDFTTVPEEPSPNIVKEKAFMSFKEDVWEEVLIDVRSPTECKQEIVKRWKGLAPALKSPYISKVTSSAEEEKPCAICETAEDEEAQTNIYWVFCNCCESWCHCRCVGITKTESDLIPYFTCPPCVKSRVVPIIKFLTLKQSTLKQKYLSVTDVNSAVAEWRVKNREEKLNLLNTKLSTVSSSVQRIKVTSKRGIVNKYKHSMCYLISMLQVVCGTTLFDLLPLNSESGLMAALTSVKVELETGANRPLAMHDDIQKIVEECNLRLGVQEDAEEVFTKLTMRLQEKAPSWECPYICNMCSLVTCTRCGEMLGEIQPGHMLEIDVVPTEKRSDVISLETLIWNKVTGLYEKKGESQLANYCKCAGDEKTIHSVQQFLTTAPNILILCINRGQAYYQSHVKIQTCLSVITTSEDEVHYRLFASINHHGANRNHGHYTSTLFGSDMIHVRNDSEAVDGCELLEDFETTTRLLFYQKTKENQLFIPEDTKKQAHGVWFGDVNVSAEHELTKEDLRTLAPKNWVNGSVIDAFLRRVSYPNPNVIVTDSHFYTSLISRRKSKQIAAILHGSIDFKTADIILVPINHKERRGEGVHWTLAAIFPQKKLIVHFDSKHVCYVAVHSVLFSAFKVVSGSRDSVTDWMFSSPTDIPYQKDGYDCGVHVMQTGLSIINGRSQLQHEVNDGTRYRITSIVMKSHISKPIHRQKQMKSLAVEATLVKRKQIIQTLKQLVEECGVDVYQYRWSTTSTPDSCSGATSRSVDVVILDDVMENQDDPVFVKEVGIEDNNRNEMCVEEQTSEKDNIEINNEKKQILKNQMVGVHIKKQKLKEQKVKKQKLEVEEDSENENANTSEDTFSDTLDSGTDHLYALPMIRDSVFLKTIQLNKKLLLSNLKSLVLEKDKKNERILAAMTLEKTKFETLQQKEMEVFQRMFGDHEIRLLLSDLKKEFSRQVKEKKGPVYQYPKVENTPLPHVPNFSQEEIMKFFLLPLVLIQHTKELQGMGSKDAEKYIYRQSLPTIFHISLLLHPKVIWVNNFAPALPIRQKSSSTSTIGFHFREQEVILYLN